MTSTWYERNKELSKQRAKAWRLANPERHRQLKKNWRKRNQKQIALKKRAKTFKTLGIEMSDDIYETILNGQGGVCFLCKNPPIKRQLAMDQVQQTGEIRGLLCSRCNFGMRFLELLAIDENLRNDVAAYSKDENVANLLKTKGLA